MRASLYALMTLFIFQFSVAETATYVLCRSDKTVRTVRIEDHETDGVCRTKYTKLGVEQTVAVSKSKKSCNTVLDNIRSNLEKASWSCKDISSSKISQDKVKSE